MADRSAAVLAEAVLGDDFAHAATLLSEQLADDPPLALWAVLVAREQEELRPRSLAELADWLARHVLGVLQWKPNRDDPSDASGDPQASGYAHLVAERLELAGVAALVAASDGQPAAELAYLAALVHRPWQWAALTADEASESAQPAPSQGPVDFGPAALAHVSRAAELLAGKVDADPLEIDVEGCRRRAEQGRQAWLAPASGLADRLPALCARLGRLEQLERRFQETLETEKLAAMAEFAAGAGHEINNPLAIIGGRAQLFLQEETDPDRRRELALMNTQVRRAHEMIADMRLFARPPQPDPETIDLGGLVDSLVAELAPPLAQRGISIGRAGEPGPVEIEADPTQLEVALRAMCKNSLEAIGHGGRIEIGLGVRGSEVEIRVSDDGPGIQPEQRRHLFDPFYSARQAGRGLGLGLSKCWRIVTNHGGRIDVSSSVGQGATFTITLSRRFAGPPSRA